MKKFIFLALALLFTVLTFIYLVMAVQGNGDIGMLHLGVPPTLAVICGDLAFAKDNEKEKE